MVIHITLSRAGGTGQVGQAKTGPLFSANSVMIVAFTNAISVNVVMIVTISTVINIAQRVLAIVPVLLVPVP